MVGGVGSGGIDAYSSMNNDPEEMQPITEQGDAVPDASSDAQVDQALAEADLNLVTDDPQAAIQNNDSEGLSIPVAEGVQEAFVESVPLPETSESGETSQAATAEISLDTARIAGIGEGRITIEAAETAADRETVPEVEMDPDPVDADEGSVDLESLISALSDASGIPESEIEEGHLEGPSESISTGEDHERPAPDNLEQYAQDQQDGTPGEADPPGKGIIEGDQDPDLMDRPQPGSSSLDAGSDAETVMIDTVPLPEKDGRQETEDRGPRTDDREAIIDPNDETSPEAIGTWPTPDSPEAIIDSSDEIAREVDQPVQDLGNQEIVQELMDELPKDAAAFSDQAAAEIVDRALADAGADFVTPLRGAIRDQYQDLSPAQGDSLLAASLLKAAESLNSGELADQLADPGAVSGIKPDSPGSNPAGEGDPVLDQAGYDPATAEYSAEIEVNNVSETTAEKADLGTAASQTELNALEAELSAVEQDLAGYAAKVEAINELKSAVREEIGCLQEELINWPDDEGPREITYSDWIQNADGSFTETEYTKTMTKAEVENLVKNLETLLETISDQSQMDMMNLQDAMNAQAQLMQMMSNIQKVMHDTAMAIIRNLK